MRNGFIYSFRNACINAIDAFYAAEEALKAVGLEE